MWTGTTAEWVVGIVSMETVWALQLPAQMLVAMAKMPGCVTLEAAQNKWRRGGDVRSLIQVFFYGKQREQNETVTLIVKQHAGIWIFYMYVFVRINPWMVTTVWCSEIGLLFLCTCVCGRDKQGRQNMLIYDVKPWNLLIFWLTLHIYRGLWGTEKNKVLRQGSKSHHNWKPKV